MSLSRRGFLGRAAMMVAGARLAGRLPLFAEVPPDKSRLIVRSPHPLDLETPVHLLNSWITPNDLFYVRAHLYTPRRDAAAWRLRVEGDVERPLELTLEEIRKFDAVEQVAVMECAGNGRAFFRPHVPGVQWEKGAVGNARWTGVRLAHVLRRAGLKSSARHIVMDGADEPMGQAPDFVRSIPLEKALDPATLLAYAMNGEPLPPVHGFPLRLIVPGWEGAAWVKWLAHLRVARAEFDGHFMRNAYRVPTYSPAPDETVKPEDMAVITLLEVKSIITTPSNGATLPAGPATMTGFAWAGEAEIERVDISTDFGRTWTRAVLGNDSARYAWRMWRHEWTARRGSCVLLSRAADSRGRVQPAAAFWNPSGYLWNVVDEVRVHVV